MRFWFASFVLSSCALFVQAQSLDSLIEADCKARAVELPPDAADAAFLRRACLDAIGRIPTPEEARRFLNSTDADKRSRLIDELLSSSGYAKHWFHHWADLLRISTSVEVTRSAIVGPAYADWLLTTLQNNVPCDRMVRDLVGRQGNIWEPENTGAVGFYQRDFEMPLDHFANLMRVFAGTRMECAQCHNHPFDHWKQMDFYKMAAFTYEVQATKFPASIFEAMQGPERGGINTITIPMRYASVRSSSLPLKLPHDYAYHDASPFQVIPAETVFGEKVRDQPGRMGTEVFAEWLTSPQHPRFTRVIVNRLWSQLFGAPLVSSDVDDLTDDTQAWNPPLETALIKLMKDLHYDMRAFLAIVMKSKAYQRRCLTNEPHVGERSHFAAPYLRRMSAEQVWDSIVTLIVDDPERPLIRRQIFLAQNLADLRHRAEKVKGGPETIRAWVKSSEGRQFVAASGREKLAAVEANVAALEQQYAKESAALDRLKPRSTKERPAFYQWKGLHDQLYRACELESPAPRGHFLRAFGQSDRLVIANASVDASVPQTLALMNSELTEGVGNPFSHLSRTIQQSSGTDAQLETLYLGILCRRPTSQETEKVMPHLQQPDGCAFVTGALLNGTEFLFIQ